MVATNSMDKIVIISQWCNMLSIIKKHLNKTFIINAELVTSIVPKVLRNNIIANFNYPIGGTQVNIYQLFSKSFFNK